MIRQLGGRTHHNLFTRAFCFYFITTSPYCLFSYDIQNSCFRHLVSHVQGYVIGDPLQNCNGISLCANIARATIMLLKDVDTRVETRYPNIVSISSIADLIIFSTYWWVIIFKDNLDFGTQQVTTFEIFITCQ